jgi:hypothetical protein
MSAVRYSIRDERIKAAKADFARASYYAEAGDVDKAAYVARRAIKTVNLINPRRRK